MYLKYADFIFKLVSPEPNNLAEPIGTDKSFFLDDNETYLPDFVVDIETKKFILDQDCTKLAAHPKAPWELFRKDRCYFIVSANKKEDLPNWTIKFDAQTFSIKAYCAKNFTKIIHGKEMLVNPFCYPYDQLLLVLILSLKQGGLLHASGAAVDGKGCVFPGISGRGKSTIAKMCIQYGLKNWLSDDRIIIRKINGEFFAYGTPWASGAKIAVNEKAPLSKLIFISWKEDGAVIKELDSEATIKKLFSVASIPWYDGDMTKLAFAFFEGLVEKVPAYELSYKPCFDSFKTIESFMLNK